MNDKIKVERLRANASIRHELLLQKYTKKKVDYPHIGKNVNLGKNLKIEDYHCYIGDNCIIGDNVQIGYGAYIGNNCRIGHETKIGQYTVLQPRTYIGCNSEFKYMSSSAGNNVIGNFVAIYPHCQIAWGQIIEDNVIIAPWFAPTNTKIIKYGRNIPYIVEPIRIKFGARIGSGVTILPKVTIGREAFIGAGAVVTKSIPDFMIAYGNPARVIREIPPEERLSEKLYSEYLKRKREGKVELPSSESNLRRSVRIVIGRIVKRIF